MYINPRKLLMAVVLGMAAVAYATPTISAVYVQSSAATTATIVWTTSTPSTSQIKYGLNNTLPYANNVNYSLVTSHSMTLTILNASQPYYFAVVSVDGGGGSAQSSTYEFALCGTPQVPVVGTVNQFYYSGTYSMTWNAPSGAGGSPTVCGQPVMTTVTGNLNLSGGFSTQVADALKVTPGPGTWTVSIGDIGDISPISVTLPLSSATQDISAELQAAAAGTSLVGVIANNDAHTVYPPWLSGGGGSGTVSSPGLTTGVYPIATGAQAIGDGTIDFGVSSPDTLSVSANHDSSSLLYLSANDVTSVQAANQVNVGVSAGGQAGFTITPDHIQMSANNGLQLYPGAGVWIDGRARFHPRPHIVHGDLIGFNKGAFGAQFRSH